MYELLPRRRPFAVHYLTSARFNGEQVVVSELFYLGVEPNEKPADRFLQRLHINILETCTEYEGCIISKQEIRRYNVSKILEDGARATAYTTKVYNRPRKKSVLILTMQGLRGSRGTRAADSGR